MPTAPIVATYIAGPLWIAATLALRTAVPIVTRTGGAHLITNELGFAYSGADSWTLAKVSLDSQPGKELWVTGPNASGKSTLLLVLAGVIPEVIEGSVAGTVDLTTADGDRSIPAMVMQDSGVYLFRSVYDEIAFVLQNRGLDPEIVAPAVAQALRVLGIEALEGRLMHTLSGGERQKVAVAAALAVEPDLVLLDEPFEQLDPASAAEVLALARGRARGGMTIVLATRQARHVPDGAQELHLVDGRVAERDTSPPEVRAAREPSTPGDTLLEMRAVTHRYSEYSGIEDVDLVVRAGESVALLGPNGAGKTTLMKHVNGLLRPQSGTVLIGGEHIARRPVWEIARDVGMLFQNPDDQIFNRVVEQEVAWGLRARGISAMDASRAALRALGELGIEHLAAENPHEITASQRQLVAFASILVVDPKLFVLDEPTKSLDARAAEVVAAAIDRRLSRGAGVLLVTHELDFARRLADRSVVLVDGSVVHRSPTGELLANREVLESARLLD